MSEPWEYEEEAVYERLYHEFGPQWAEEHGLSAYDDVVKEFNSNRLIAERSQAARKGGMNRLMQRRPIEIETPGEKPHVEKSFIRLFVIPSLIIASNFSATTV